MKRRVVFSLKANADLVLLYEYIAARSGAERAFEHVERIREFCSSLHTFPERGTPWDHVIRGARVVGFERRASIAFRITPQTVNILRIFYGGRDLGKNLKAK